MVDLATDINVIRVYFGEEGQEGYGWMMLGMVLASMGLQLGLVLLQNGKMGWGKLLREVLIVVSGLKPGERERRTKREGSGTDKLRQALDSRQDSCVFIEVDPLDAHGLHFRHHHAPNRISHLFEFIGCKASLADASHPMGELTEVSVLESTNSMRSSSSSRISICPNADS